MTSENNAWWRNCGHLTEEMIEIDKIIEGHSLPADIISIRWMITKLEMCHHKAERWVQHIIEAIGTESLPVQEYRTKPDEWGEAQQLWQNCVAVLIAWCAGCPADAIPIHEIDAVELVKLLGERTPLKEWLAQRVIARIAEYTAHPRNYKYQSLKYVPMAEHPEYYSEHSDYWQFAMTAAIHDTKDGQPSEIALATAIDMLLPCHWNFLSNLKLVLGAIGGNYNPSHSFKVCDRNIQEAPIRERMKVISHTLCTFANLSEPGEGDDLDIYETIGKPTVYKIWLASSLVKTIRIQLKF